ncbi:aromatic ring-hydroxylating dioxygenase subunit alpha [Oscillatoria sp. FACHB-1407]|uniref:aromatic ring-hydroxylating oxygenase subunit alpha n=1 Tax=Oscillatoria sp. FACHB-1407 TaxID=2692847 RepID=UPI001687387D|nr:aromatic ring-hydroxylating dioxygenase subunit alpha [Oscillatoria sp. FACHB-1407]MBD2462539.1 aromatic ring-hydroxylating dioxygenase subunit alpha [Oscillatoria sp. FACHB-1407]
MNLQTQQETGSRLAWLRSWQPRSLHCDAMSLPAEMYFSPDIYRLEQQHVFGKHWYYVGHISQLEEAGSYFTVDIAGQPLIILKNRVGELRAFFNICTHRAGPLALGSGKCNHLTCLYHAWSFDLDGNLRGIPDMEAAENFDTADYGLAPVQIDTWGPFIFVNPDLNAPPLAVQLGDLPDLFQRYQLDTWRRVHTIDYWVDANWKLYVENNAEYYHEPIVHPCLLRYYKHNTAEARHYHYLQYTPVLTEDDRWFLADPGYYIPGLTPEEMERIAVMSFFPNFAWILSPGHAIIYLIDPQGPTRTRIRWEWLVPNTAIATAEENVQPLVEFGDKIQKEDLLLLPEIQKRVQAIGYKPGRLSPTKEMGTHLFQEFIMKAIQRGEGKG